MAPLHDPTVPTVLQYYHITCVLPQVSFTTACRKISMCILLFYSCDFFKVIKKGYMCISNNRTKHGFHVFLLILSRDARSGIMISSLGSKCQHFKVGMPVFQPFYDMKLKTSKFKVLAF